jgi:hypothetical protein
MKPILSILFILSILCACKPSATPISPVKPIPSVPPAVAIPPPPPAPAWQPITGAFNYSLGEQLPDSQLLVQDDRGEHFATILTPDNDFVKEVRLCVLDDRRIFRMFAMLRDGEKRDDLLRALSSKYGPSRMTADSTWTIGSGSNIISVFSHYTADMLREYVSLDYISLPLTDLARNEQKARDDIKAKADASGL